MAAHGLRRDKNPLKSNCSSEPPVNLRRLNTGDARVACLAEGARVCEKLSYELTKSQSCACNHITDCTRAQTNDNNLVRKDCSLCWTRLEKEQKATSQMGKFVEVVWWTATNPCFHILSTRHHRKERYLRWNNFCEILIHLAKYLHAAYTSTAWAFEGVSYQTELRTFQQTRNNSTKKDPSLEQVPIL